MNNLFLYLNLICYINFGIAQCEISSIISEKCNYLEYGQQIDKNLITNSLYPFNDSTDYLNIMNSDSIYVYRFDELSVSFYNGLDSLLNSGESLICITYDSEKQSLIGVKEFISYLKSPTFSVGSSLLIKGGAVLSRRNNKLFIYFPSDKINNTDRFDLLSHIYNLFIINGSDDTFFYFGGKFCNE